MKRVHIDDLKKLKDGWGDGIFSYSSKITQEAISTVENLSVIPTYNGGLQIEIHSGNGDVEIEVRPDGSIGGVCSGYHASRGRKA